MTILIRGGTVVNHDHSGRADVLVDKGKIVEFGSSLDPPADAEVIDADGCFAMPGGIDSRPIRTGGASRRRRPVTTASTWR